MSIKLVKTNNNSYNIITSGGVGSLTLNGKKLLTENYPNDLFNSFSTTEEIKKWFLITHPIGTYYITSGESPAELYGGGWDKIEGRFLLGSGTSPQSANTTYTLGNTGGSKNAVVVSHTHRAGSHAGDMMTEWGTNAGGAATFVGLVGGTKKYSAGYDIFSIHNTGVDGIDKNMPPYVVVNIYRRYS